MNRTTRLLVLALVVAGAVAARQWRAANAPAAPKTAATGLLAVPAGASHFRLGQLAFDACELPQRHSAATTRAFCAPFSVPENWDAPDGRRIDLRLALIASDEPADDDLLVLLAGGPGQSAVDGWPQVAAAFEPARKRHHVLLLDQRGTGRSHPLTCPAPDADALDQGFDLERVRTQTRACLDVVSATADPRLYTTTMAVRDLEAVRVALGSPKLDLVGVSYGTRVAQQYLKRHPDGVRSLVLDGPVPNDLVVGAEFTRNLDEALKANFASCAADADCHKAYGDPYATLRVLRDRLQTAPQQVDYADPVRFVGTRHRLDGDALAGFVRLFAYAPESAALIPLALHEAEAGRYAPLMAQLALISSGVEELAGSGMPLSVLCSEDADRLAVDPRDADTVLGPSLVQGLIAQCAIWPHGERPADFSVPASGDTPVLVLAGQFDPVTPPRYGEAIVRGLGNARLVVAAGQGHNVIGRGCLPKVVGRFLDGLDPKALDTSCVDALGPIPAFLDYNGAAP